MSEPKPWPPERHIEEILNLANSILAKLTEIETASKLSLKNRIGKANAAAILTIGIRIQANALKEKLEGVSK